MDYIKEVNAFYDAIETKDLTSTAISLWLALLHINSKVDWAREFKVSEATLRSKAGLPKTSFKRARKKLIELGLIEHKTRGNRAIYRMKRLSIEDEKKESHPAIFLDMKEKEKVNLRRIANELNLSHTDVNDEIKELIEKYSKENV